MLRHVLAVAAFVAAMAVAPAFAEPCSVAPGDYVDADLRDEVVSPAIVLEASGDPCYVTVRVLAVPGEPFDAYTPAYYEEFLQPLAGPPPYDKPYGCPYAPGDLVDLRDQYNTWYPGRVTGSDRYCGYDAEYWMDNQWKTFGAVDADLRPATLPMPTPEEIEVIEREALVMQSCGEGGEPDDYADDDVKYAIASEVAEQLNLPTSVFFDRMLVGETATASDGSVYQQRNPDAAHGATIYPYRVDVSICVPSAPAAEVSRFRLDYSCYTDRFQTFVCRRDASRSLD